MANLPTYSEDGYDGTVGRMEDETGGAELGAAKHDHLAILTAWSNQINWNLQGRSDISR